MSVLFAFRLPTDGARGPMRRGVDTLSIGGTWTVVLCGTAIYEASTRGQMGAEGVGCAERRRAKGRGRRLKRDESDHYNLAVPIYRR